jgi:hypothetical protein
MMVEFEPRRVGVPLQLVEVDVEVRDAFFGIEAHRHGQVALGLAHHCLIHGRRP